MAHDDFLDSTLEVTITADRKSIVRKGGVEGSAILIVLSGSRIGHRMILGAEPATIGRGSAATLQIEGDSVSRIHVRIEWRDDAHWVVDTGSTNGTFVNYAKAKERRLEDGDLVQIGQVLCKYLSGDNIETAYHEEFRRLARRDALTGALNRITFDEEFRIAIAQADRKKGQVSLILFDLDHFKKINDTRGHTAGDLVLSAVGRFLEAKILEPHLAARVGGEEFAVLCIGDLALARSMAEEIRREVEALAIVFEGKAIAVTTSVGVAAWTAGPPAQVYQDADERLYRAKEGGRNRVVSDE